MTLPSEITGEFVESYDRPTDHLTHNSVGSQGPTPVAHWIASFPDPKSGCAKTSWKITRSWSQWLKTSCSKESSKNSTLPSSHVLVIFETLKVAQFCSGVDGIESLGGRRFGAHDTLVGLRHSSMKKKKAWQPMPLDHDTTNKCLEKVLSRLAIPMAWKDYTKGFESQYHQQGTPSATWAVHL